MTFNVACPDEDCAEEFTIEREPKDLEEGGELIACPACLEEWEWEYDAVDGIVLTLPEIEDEDDLDDEEDADELTETFPDDEE